MNPIIATAIGALGVLTVLLLGSVRLVPSGTCAVVTRFGRVTRVATPGLVGTSPSPTDSPGSPLARRATIRCGS